MFEQDNTGGEPVYVVLVADGAQFPLGEESGERQWTKCVLDRSCIVI